MKISNTENGKNSGVMQVAALENGTVIDHIPPEHLFKVAQILKLYKETHRITIGNNLDSRKIGKKGIIKISDRYFTEQEISSIALVAPKARLNIIRNFQVSKDEKKDVTLPDQITDIVKCNNPKCISNNEPMPSKFTVIDKDNVTIRCHYCERKINQEDLVIK
ncbi:MAG: aspartate carbamoyltransferase regulatory subunit [Tannerella sp.]|jgi:aspartate carbamoyltransferase regulatory subunit|nr:aspartate carbamoyltransferase regulatory subunit [Tannerella sp.]